MRNGIDRPALLHSYELLRRIVFTWEAPAAAAAYHGYHDKCKSWCGSFEQQDATTGADYVWCMYVVGEVGLRGRMMCGTVKVNSMPWLQEGLQCHGL